MNVDTIKMDPVEARRLYQEYMVSRKVGHIQDEKKLADRHTEEDKAVIASYKAIADGKTILNIIDVMRSSGMSASWQPRLAIVRADAKTVWFRYKHEHWVFSMDRWPSDTYANRRWDFSEDVFEDVDPDVFGKNAIQAVVPTIPPAYRPRGRMYPYYLLWEPIWSKRPPKDPILLRIVKWPIFAVIAQWDLTEVERGVLEGRDE